MLEAGSVWCELPKGAVIAAASASVDMLYLFALFAIPVLLVMAVLLYFFRPHMARTKFYLIGIGLYLLISVAVAIATTFAISDRFGFLLVPLYAPFFLGIGCLPLGLLLLLFRNSGKGFEPHSGIQKVMASLLLGIGAGSLLLYLSFPIGDNLRANHWETRPVKDSSECLRLGGKVGVQFPEQGTPPTAVNETVAWKTFVNARDGYSVKYPENEVEPSTDYSSELNSYGFETSTTFIRYGGWADIYLFNGTLDKAITAHAKIDSEHRVYRSPEEIIIGGKKGRVVSWTSTLGSPSAISRSYFVEYKPGKTLYISGPREFVATIQFL